MIAIIHTEKTPIFTSNIRFKKAFDDYKAAMKNLSDGYYMAANDRAYFCMYHAARGLLVLDGHNTEITGAVISILNERYISQGLCDPRLIEMFEEVRKSRMEGLNCDLRIEREDEARRNVENAGYFLTTLSNIHKRRLTSVAMRCPECGQMPRRHNERGAGRKRIASRELITRVMELRDEGLSYERIAAKLFNERSIKIGITTVGEIVRGKYTPPNAE